MVDEEEIKKMAKMMRIKITDHREYVDKVHAMIGYFDILDSAGTEDEEIATQEITLSDLRKDEHVPFGDKLIDGLNCYHGTYIRAPKMS